MWLRRLLIPAVLTPTVAFAGGHSHVDRARVVEVEPIYHTVEYAVPREQCRVVDVPYDRGRGHRASTSAPIVGAIIGGALGNAVGHKKSNKRVGAAVGALLGGSIGYDISRRNHERRHVSYRTQEVCEVVDDYRTEEKLSGYDVTYRYAGQTYTTRMDSHPGTSIPVRVSVSPT